MWQRPLSRRAFLGVAATAASSSHSIAEDNPKRKYRYIDIHTHVGTFYPGKELTADGLVKLMDRDGIEKAVILPLVSPESSPYLQTSESALEAAKKHPDRLIPFCCLDPRSTTGRPERFGHVEGLKGFKDILKRYQDAGARGLGEHKVGLPFAHKQMMTLYEACQDLYLPILFHLDDIRSFDTVGLPRLEEAIKAFPKLPFMGHAAGFWASISGDATDADFGRYPKIPTPVTEGGVLDRLMAKYPNLYGDLSEPGGVCSNRTRQEVRPGVPHPSRRPASVRHRLPHGRPDDPALRTVRFARSSGRCAEEALSRECHQDPEARREVSRTSCIDDDPNSLPFCIPSHHRDRVRTRAAANEFRDRARETES